MARLKHRIEIRDFDGKLLWVVKDVAEATLDKSINNPATMSFCCPNSTQTGLIRSDLDRTNSIWAWRENSKVFTGPIGLTKTIHKSNIEVRVDALDYLAALKGEYVELYDGLDSTPDHVAAILAQQVSARPVRVGTIEPGIDMDITIEKDYIYTGLMKFRDCVGGYIQVDPERRLNWYWLPAASSGQQLRYRKNMLSITRDVDWLNFGNRLYIYGDGVDLTDAGWPTTYIENTDSQARYDIVTRKLNEPSFATAATMLAYAKLKIAEMAWPRITYTLDIVNLADFGIDWEALSLGSVVRLIDEELDIDVEVQIVRIIYDLVKGQNIQVELATTSLNILDIVPGNYVL